MVKQTFEWMQKKADSHTVLQVPIIMQPHAWWQHAIEAVVRERCDLLRLETRRQLRASTLWVLQKQYIAAYLKQQRASGLAALLMRWTSWTKGHAMKVSRCDSLLLSTSGT